MTPLYDFLDLPTFLRRRLSLIFELESGLTVLEFRARVFTGELRWR